MVRLADPAGPTKMPSAAPTIQNTVRSVASSATVPQISRPTRAIRIVRLEPIRSSMAGEGEGAEAGGEVQRDAEHDDLRRVHAERAGGIDAAEGEQRVQPVLVDHPGEQEPRTRLAWLRTSTSVVAQGAQPLRTAAPNGSPAPLRSGHDEEQRQAEHAAARRHRAARRCGCSRTSPGRGRTAAVRAGRSRTAGSRGRRSRRCSPAPSRAPTSGRPDPAATARAASSCRRSAPPRCRHWRSRPGPAPAARARRGA